MWLILLFQMLHIGFSQNLLPTETAHDIHMTNSSSTYRTEKNLLEITVTLFTDDFEDALSKMHGERKWALCTGAEMENANNYILRYIESRLEFISNSTSYPLHFLKKEPTEDLLAVTCYLEVRDLPLSGDFTVKNELMLEMFNDQKNILNIGIDRGKRKHYMFDHKAREKKISL